MMNRKQKTHLTLQKSIQRYLKACKLYKVKIAEGTASLDSFVRLRRLIDKLEEELGLNN